MPVLATRDGVEAKASTPLAANRRPRSRMVGGTTGWANIFYLPAIILFAVFVIYPLCRGVYLSFTKWNGRSPKVQWVGFDNYLRLLGDDNFWTAFGNTIVYGFGSTLLQNLLGLAFALLLNGRFIGRTSTRAIIYLPVMIAPIIMGYVMYFFVKYDQGAINDVLGLFGVAPVDWMADGTRAVIIITLVNTLQFTGVAMVIYLAGLQSIPAMYYEAAQLDGATTWQQFRNVTLPMLVPAITSAVMINLIGGLKLFDVITALAGGNYPTNSLSTLVNRVYFGSESAGYASAIGVVTFVFIVLVATVANSYFSRKEVAQ